MIRALAIIPLALFLGGCPQHSAPTSIAGSECKVFEAPPFAIAGRTDYDQDWINSTVEGGVGACRWPRPKARPPEIDAPRATVAPAIVQPAPKKRQGPVKRFVKRIKARVWPVEVEPFTPTPVPRPTVSQVVEPPPPPPAVSAIDRLLNPALK